MSFDTDVLIIGAGPVGMTLANELIRHGVKPRIVDRANGIREVSKAMILHVRTQEVLDKVGIVERARREAQPLTEVVVHAYGKHIGSWDLDEIDSPYKHPLILGQNRTQHALLDLMRSRGGEVEWGREATSLVLDADGATAEIVSGDGAKTAIRARYVVGCEGSNSLVRRALNLSFAGERYSGEQFIQADCRIKWALPKGRSYLFLTAVGYMMVIEFPDGVVRVFISLPDTDADSAGAKEAAGQLGAVEAVTEQPTLDEIGHHLTRLSGFDCQLSDASWLARYRTSHRYANRFSQGRAFIAGDAAHVHVPIGGQGMNTGIQDAFNLGWKLAGVCNGELQPSILVSSQDERHPVRVADPGHKFRLYRHSTPERGSAARGATVRAIPDPQRNGAGFHAQYAGGIAGVLSGESAEPRSRRRQWAAAR
jgi:3-(3-hydroxy-phenyl)propionate hydroxylase